MSRLQGEELEIIQGPDGREYSLVIGKDKQTLIAFFGYYAGSDLISTECECHFWWPMPVPANIKSNKELMHSLYGTATMYGALLFEPQAKLH
jgi:hypothetical protein